MSRRASLITKSISRGLLRRCPRCGDGKLFSSWYTLNPRCEKCGLEYEAGDGDTWGVMYVGTAFFTGLFILLIALVRPPQNGFEKILYILIIGGLMIGTLPQRKGLALAIDYLLRGDTDPASPPDPLNEGTTDEHTPTLQ